MSINSCSINAFTINGLACRRRSFGPIPPQPPTSGGGSVQHYRYQNWYGRPDREEDEDVDYSKLEGFNIAVTITMNGQSFSQTVENNPSLDVVPMIAINNLQVEPVTPNIRIQNLKLRREPKQ